MGIHSLIHSIMEIERCAETLEWKLKQMTNKPIIHINLHKSNNKLINAWFEHFWCMNKPQAHIDLQDSSWLGLEKSHHLPFYSILCDSSHELHSNIILFWNSQVRSFEIFKIVIPSTLNGHNFLCKHSIEMRSKTKL